MDYRLELLDNTRFEKLANTICQKLLGMGVISFSTGKDGGRDGKFEGTAQNYPSYKFSWSGKFIIQAKHTESCVGSCSDSSFQREIIKKEVPKIIKLKEAGEIDCYLIFTNRKYSGVKGEEFLKEIKKRTGIDNTAILGKEAINNEFLNNHPDIVRIHKLNQLNISFDFSEDEIRDIILTLKQQLPQIESDIKNKVDILKYDFNVIAHEVKNRKNELSSEYYENEIRDRSLMDFNKIQYFLESPKNSELKDFYFDIAAELRNLITLNRNDFQKFEEIFLFIYKKVCDGNTQLKGTKRHVLTLLHYMYVECLIGKK